ncbi:MAG: type II toxin-antitoxin system VapB family antitoxin [Gammaproteobacteria bacterium]|nr:type II toxin-antitoxin system VapB family antitoxin [Gammaproteobacteria bacterium]MCY4283144.1 type II toxin-antitoxin system VapB family antitoxin [Gammaproteobacteria bacterium]MCY4339394.1 type II toxin-antitoxin system VapB family antitoxin [Gammaproteobacteria bacterium]
MKTTIDIPERELADAIQFANAKTKREAVVTAIIDFNQRKRMVQLMKYAGTCEALVSAGALQAERRQG